MTAPPSLSVVVPVFNESANIAPLFAEIREVAAMLGRSFEIIYVNDGSTDTTLQDLIALQARHSMLRILDLDGNFGEAAALCAGFQAARGDLVITLDGDGQNDPHDIPRLLATLEQRGLRVVSGWRQARQEDALVRVLPSRIANTFIRWLTGIPLHDNGCGLKVYRRTLVRGATLPDGLHRFIPAVFGVTAAEVAEVPVHDRRRQRGQSHYGISRTLAVLRDLLAIPFLAHHPVPKETWSMIVTLAATAHTLSSGGLLTAVAAPIAAAVWWNLRRYNRAQRDGVYRVRREYSASA